MAAARGAVGGPTPPPPRRALAMAGWQSPWPWLLWYEATRARRLHPRPRPWGLSPACMGCVAMRDACRFRFHGSASVCPTRQTDTTQELGWWRPPNPAAGCSRCAALWPSQHETARPLLRSRRPHGRAVHAGSLRRGPRSLVALVPGAAAAHRGGGARSGRSGAQLCNVCRSRVNYGDALMLSRPLSPKPRSAAQARARGGAASPQPPLAPPRPRGSRPAARRARPGRRRGEPAWCMQALLCLIRVDDMRPRHFKPDL